MVDVRLAPYFDKHQRSAIPGNDVDFPSGAAKVSPVNTKTERLYMAPRELFSLVAGLFTMRWVLGA